MEEQQEYCTGQDFQVVFVQQPPYTDGGFQVWQCRACAYEIRQRPISDTPPVVPPQHPKPTTTRIMVTDEQKAWLREELQMDERAETDDEMRALLTDYRLANARLMTIWMLLQRKMQAHAR